jgi:hypothetical protein
VQHGPAKPKAATLINANPVPPSNAGIMLLCFRQPGAKAAMAIVKQMRTIHLWKASSAKKPKPHAGSEAITNGIAAQWMAQPIDVTIPIQSPILDTPTDPDTLRASWISRKTILTSYLQFKFIESIFHPTQVRLKTKLRMRLAGQASIRWSSMTTPEKW